MAEPMPVRVGVTKIVIPNRRADFPSGSELMNQIKAILGDTIGISGPELLRRSAKVEELIYQEINRGNVPDFMRPQNFPQITLEKTVDGKKVQATVRVCPDYLAIGSNVDFVRMPVSAPLAQRIADRYNFSLPTRKLVEILDDEAKRTNGYLPFVAAPTLAEHVTNPRTGKPAIEGEKGKRWNYQQYGFYEGRWMLSGEFIEEQNRQINAAWKKAGNPPGIRSGHKKDVLYDERNFKESLEGGQPVVIFHNPFQGISNVHKVDYFDYSHGIRFIDNNVELTITEKDGAVRRETKPFTDVLNDPKLYQLVSYCRVDTSRLYRNMNIHLEPRAKKAEPIPQ